LELTRVHRHVIKQRHEENVRGSFFSQTKRVSTAVTLAAAQPVIDAARKHADMIDVPMNVTVVDEGANLVAFVRMDGALLGSIEISRNKAYTARAFDMSTKELAKICQPGEPSFGIASSTDHKIAIFPGGIPLLVNGEVVGAVGVSGRMPDQDHAVAEAGASAFESALPRARAATVG
jgi:uncharacterized protein GlcG (DUF336 family)